MSAKTKGDDLVESAKQAVREVFGDRTVSPRETQERLKSIAGDIEVMCDALESDIRRAEDGG